MVKRLISALRQHGYKLTRQRQTILKVISASQSHLTPTEIFKKISKEDSSIGLVTVYRTLDLLEESGCVVKSELDGRFIYHHAEEGHHHHLVCRECGRTINCNENIFADLKKSLKESLGFQADLKHVMINGICSDCQKKR